MGTSEITRAILNGVIDFSGLIIRNNISAKKDSHKMSGRFAWLNFMTGFADNSTSVTGRGWIDMATHIPIDMVMNNKRVNPIIPIS
jgi:hypothetical protein